MAMAEDLMADGVACAETAKGKAKRTFSKRKVEKNIFIIINPVF
jgi:hypothetical protein